jgi:hypothetical protein
MIRKCKPYKGKSEYSTGVKLRKGLPVTEVEMEAFRLSKRSQPSYKKLKRVNLTSLDRRAKRLLYNAESRAKKIGVPFDLTFEWLLPKLQAGKCDVTGIAFDFESAATAKNKYAPSLDREDPAKGYTKTNVRLVVWIYNSAKGENTHNELLEFAQILVSTNIAVTANASNL